MELRKSGVDAQTARKQAYWDITPAPIANAPVAWVAPAITPIAPAPTTPIDNKQVLANNQAKVAWEIQAGTRPAVWQQSESLAPPTWTTTPSGATLNADWTVTNAPPVNATANPTTPAPTATPTTATASNTEAKVETKIETPKAEVTKTAEVPPPPITIGDMFNNIVNKIDVPPEQKALSTYKIAQNRYNKANMFATMTPAELSSQMKDAKIVEWSPAWEDLKMLNPWLVQSVKWLNIVNGVNPEIFTYVNNPDGTKVKQNNLVNSFVSDYEDNYGDIVKILRDIYSPQGQSARDAIYTPEVRAAEDKATSIELEMNRLSDTIDWIDKDIEKEYAWTGATGSRVALEKQYRQEHLKTQYNSLLKNYTTYANKANNLITQNSDIYKSAQAQKTALQSALAGVALIQYQSQLGLQNKAQEMQMEADFAKKQAYENINDPATAINNVMEEYKKLGIPFTTALQSRLLQEFAQSGLSLPDYLTQMTESIQASPAYKQYAEKKAWEGISYQAFGDKVYKNVNGILTETAISNAKPAEAKAPEWAQDMDGNWYNKNSSVSPAEQVSSWIVDTGWATYFDALGKNVGTYTWNRWIDLAWNIGEPLFSGWDWKVISTDTAREQKGSIFQPWKWAKPYGNTVVMEDENGNKIRFSHLDSVNVKKDDVLWYGTVLWTRGNTWHVLGKNGETLTPEQLAAGRGAHVDIEIKDKSGRLLSESEQKAYLQWIKQPNPFETTNLSLYRAYAEDGKLPSKDALKGLKMNSQKFIQNADAWYTKFLESQAKEISAEQPTLDIVYNPQKYSAISATQREKLNESVIKIGDIDRRITRLRELFDENGTEVIPTKAKAEMNSLRQQIILKAKEVENLWVLNWPDLWILEDLLPSTTWFWSGVWSFDSNTITKLQSIQNNYRNDAKTKSVNYGAKLIFADPVEKELAASFPPN